ncbi:MAG: class I SAM-dependent methyltransferase [Candidatus Bathyarchaeia archaeon]
MFQGERKAQVTRPLHEVVAKLYRIITLNEAWTRDCRRMGAIAIADMQDPCVLDLGTGPGHVAIEIINLTQHAYIVGFDLAVGMLREAAILTQGTKEIQLVRGDAHSLPFKSGIFDAITGHSFLYLTTNPHTVLAEAKRTLKSRGKLVLMEPSSRISWRVLLKSKGNLNFILSMIGWRILSLIFGRYGSESLRNILLAAGYGQVHTENTLDGLGVIASAVK